MTLIYERYSCSDALAVKIMLTTIPWKLIYFDLCEKMKAENKVKILRNWFILFQLANKNVLFKSLT